MNFCPNCGTRLIGKAKFCSECGYDLVLLPLVYDSPEEKINKENEGTILKQKQLETERLAREAEERAEQERLERESAEKAEAERLERERLEQERIAREEAERAEAERLAREEAKRLERERAEQERLEQERLAKEAAEREEAERLAREAAEKAEAERLAREAAEKAEAERLEQERVRKEKEEAERLERERKEAERLAEEQRIAEEKRKAEEERLALKKAEQEKRERIKQERKAALQAKRETPLSNPLKVMRIISFVSLGLAFALGIAAIIFATVVNDPHYQIQETYSLIVLISMIAAGVFGLASLALGIVFLVKTARRMAFIPMAVGAVSIAIGAVSLPLDPLYKASPIQVEIEGTNLPFELTGKNIFINQNIFVLNWETSQGANPTNWVFGSGIGTKVDDSWGIDLTVRSDYGYVQIFVTNQSYTISSETQKIPTSKAIYYSNPFKYGDYFTKASVSAFDGKIEVNSMDLSKLVWNRGGEKLPKNIIHAGTIDDPYTVADALQVADGKYVESGYCRGVVKSAGTKLGTAGDIGNIKLKDPDEDNEILIYYLKRYKNCPNEDNFHSVDDIKVGDELLIFGSMLTYNGTPEIGGGTYCVTINGVAQQ